MASLYVEKETMIHSIHPINKLFYTVATILIPLILSNIGVTAAFIVVNLLLLSVGKVLRRTLPIISVSLLLMVSIMAIQGLFHPGNATVLFRFWIFTYYREGFLHALSICLNLLDIIFSFSVLVLTTRPSDLIESLVKKGMSSRMGYVLCSVLQIIPEMITATGTIMDAQKSRGLEMSGSVINRVKAFIPLIGPVVMGSLLSTRERAIALEVRGFNSKAPKTFTNVIEDRKYDRVIRTALVLLIVLALGWRVATWLS